MIDRDEDGRPQKPSEQFRASQEIAQDEAQEPSELAQALKGSIAQPGTRPAHCRPANAGKTATAKREEPRP